MIAFLIVLVLALVILIPVLASQLSDFIVKLPEYLSRFQALVTSYDPNWLEQRFGLDAGSLQEGLNSLLTSGMGLVTTVFQYLIRQRSMAATSAVLRALRDGLRLPAAG